MTSDDEAAFTGLFDAHRDAVHAFLLARTSDVETAHDLLQETFLRLWRRLGEVAPLGRGRQRAWLITVARNLVVDRYRADATRKATVVAVAVEARHAAAHQADAVDQVAARDELGTLDRAIAALPDDEREVLTMTVVAGMTSTQVGDALDLPAGTVRYRLHRARTRLAERLEVT